LFCPKTNRRYVSLLPVLNISLPLDHNQSGRHIQNRKPSFTFVTAWRGLFLLSTSGERW